MDVAEWLRALGLQQYEATFREHDITAAVLPNLSAEDLKDIGIAVVGHRHRLLDAVAALRAPHQVTQSAAERRQLTVMFCDVMDFTPLSSRLDPEDLSAVIREYQSRVATNIARFGGFIARYVGDGVLIYFGWPEAHEADAERAVRAALAVIAAIDQMAIQSERLRIRIGIATGLVVIGAPIGTGEARQQTAIGETPNLAARLQALAGADGVVIDQTTRRQLGSLFDCHDLGRLELKGFAEPVPAWQVLGERMIDSRFAAFHSGALSPLIGRNAELGLLLECWQRAKAGEGQALLVSGEAGIGKSRLIAAFETQLEGDAPARSRYFCSPDHTDTALHPVIAALQHEAGFVRSDTDADKLGKLRSMLVSTTPATADVALIADMLSIPLNDRPPILDASPQARKEATFAALIAHLQSLARMRPLLVVLEDAHWADASSIELFNAVMPALTDVPALVIISTRDGDPKAWLGRVRTLALSRLDRRQSAALATSIIADDRLAPELIDRIVDQTDGIPLFVEELTKTVVETASADSAGRVPLAVPASLQASLMARLDRIPVAKEVAQVGAVFGREFAHVLLATVAALPEQTLLRGLQQLIDAGLAAREGTPPNARYTFKHALVRDTAYGMLLRSRRRELHASAATVLVDQSPELRARQPELLAHHYAQAGMIEPAISYWAKAARRSVARSAMVEAVAQVHQALELVPELPEGPARLRQELELQGLLGGALFALQAWSDGSAMRAFARAQELAEQLEDVEATARFLAGQVTYHIGQCQYREARDVAVKLLRISENSDTPIVQLIAHRCMAVCLHWTGQFTDALVHFDRVLDLYDPARDRQLAGILGFDVYVQAAFLACWDLLILGQPEQAAARFELARTQLRDIEHKHSHALALGYGSVWSLFMGDRASAFRQLTETLELATEQRFAAWVGTADLLLGSVFATAADGARGLAQAREGYARYAAAAGISHADTGLVLNATFYLSLLAHACEAAGMPAEAREHLDTALDVAARSGERWFEPELHRLKAEWLLRNAPREEAQAEATLEHAIDLAFRQNALFWELRASVSLARLHVALGRPERARALLNRVCEKFSDKRALPELREAETLLAGLLTLSAAPGS